MRHGAAIARGWCQWRSTACLQSLRLTLQGGRVCSTSPGPLATTPAPLGLPKTLIFGDPTLVPSPQSQLVADPVADVKHRLRALGEVTTPPVHLYNTNAHLTFTNFLLHHMGTLNRGSFPVNGTHARTIVGPKGIGVSTLLRQLVTAAEVIFPNVISMYVSHERPRGDELMVTLGRHLVGRGIIDSSTMEDAIRTDTLDDVVLDSLMSKGKRLLLVVDEMDHLYRLDHTKSPEEARAAFRTLGSLALLGSVGGPVSAVLLCGTSVVLPLLITTNATRDDHLRKEYPGVVGAPNLNGTKYSELRVYAGLPTDLATAQIVCEHIRANIGLPCDISIARLALFTAGGSPRLLEKGASTGAVSPDDHHASPAMSSSITLCGPTSDLHMAIVDELQQLNKDLLRSLQDHKGRVDAALVSTVQWETQLRPLTWKAVWRLWRQVNTDSKGLTEAGLQSEVLRLVDRGYLTLDMSSREVYPPAVSALLFDSATGTNTPSRFRLFAKAAMAIARPSAPGAAAVVEALKT